MARCEDVLGDFCGAWKAKEQTAFLLDLCPELHIEGKGRSGPLRGDSRSRSIDRRAAAAAVERDGFAHFTRDFVVGQGGGVDKAEASEQERFALLTANAMRLAELGWPPSTLLLFDETWQVVEEMNTWLEVVSAGRNVRNDDILVFLTPPGGDGGFNPHRDRQPVPGSTVMDGFHTGKGNPYPKYTTCWRALNHATVANSCLYMVPASQDPGYFGGDLPPPRAPMPGSAPQLDPTDPLHRALVEKEDFQRIRAFPCSPGEAVVFSHRTIHWGSRGGDGCLVPPPPRVSIAVAASSADFEPRYIEPAPARGKAPPFATRVALLAGQLLVYNDRFQFSRAVLRLWWSVFQQGSGAFSRFYRLKVANDFAQAVRGGLDDAPSTLGGAGDASDEVSMESGSSDEEAMLEAMLGDEMHTEFHDDFDDVFSGSDDAAGGAESDEEEEQGGFLEALAASAMRAKRKAAKGERRREKKEKKEKKGKKEKRDKTGKVALGASAGSKKSKKAKRLKSRPAAR